MIPHGTLLALCVDQLAQRLDQHESSFLPLTLIPTNGDQATQMDTPMNIAQCKH